MKNLKNKKEFLVALHVLDRNQTKTQAAKILVPGGAHGALLVNNGGYVVSTNEEFPNLFDITHETKDNYPDYIVGINPLDLPTLDAVKAMQRTDSSLNILWTDQGGIVETETGATFDLLIREQLPNRSFQYYGSELFKVGMQAKNPEAVAKAAAQSFDGFITSGKATGSAPDIAKIKQIREWIGPDAKLGIASGMSIENIELFLPYADIFIVGTSLCRGNGMGENMFYYEEDKIRAFRAKIDTWETKFQKLASLLKTARNEKGPDIIAGIMQLQSQLGLPITG